MLRLLLALAMGGASGACALAAVGWALYGQSPGLVSAVQIFAACGFLAGLACGGVAPALPGPAGGSASGPLVASAGGPGACHLGQCRHATAVAARQRGRPAARCAAHHRGNHHRPGTAAHRTSANSCGLPLS